MAGQGRVEPVGLTGTGRSRRADKVVTRAAAVLPFADFRGVAGRMPEGRVCGAQREFIPPGSVAAIAAAELTTGCATRAELDRRAAWRPVVVSMPHLAAAAAYASGKPVLSTTP